MATAFTASTFDGSCPEVTWISRLLDAPAEEPTFTLTVITFEAPPLRSKVTVPALTALVMFDEPSKYEIVYPLAVAGPANPIGSVSLPSF